MQADLLPARQTLRRQARALRAQPMDTAAHFARLGAALSLPGAEPAQGALADLFGTHDASQQAIKRAALAMVRDRLAPHVVRWFDMAAGRGALGAVHPMATRWSVLVQPGASMATRARRCSPDVSRELAVEVVAAVARGDEEAQQAFLHHCLTCHDNLAFMLARRSLMRGGGVLPEGWDAVSAQLQQGAAV